MDLHCHPVVTGSDSRDRTVSNCVLDSDDDQTCLSLCIRARHTSNKLPGAEMKVQLLAAVLLMIATPSAAQDLEVTTDLGEKYFLIDSAVKATPMTGATGVALQNEGAAGFEARFNKCLEGPLSRSKCTEIYEPEKTASEYKNRILSIKNDPERVHWVSLRFRGIFLDLNGQKSPTQYQSVACLNPKISAEAIAAWDYSTGIVQFAGEDFKERASVPDFNSEDAWELVKIKACERYANF